MLVKDKSAYGHVVDRNDRNHLGELGEPRLHRTYLDVAMEASNGLDIFRSRPPSQYALSSFSPSRRHLSVSSSSLS